FTALIHLWKKNTILSVLAGTLLYVALRNLL
ncbi:MAG: AzlD domain-containing protein, partial [Lachnospiraceae bacterium]|nr:AzlD domain-containing protein [Lachnospiraceae bacterium]